MTARAQRDAVEGIQTLQTSSRTNEQGIARLDGLLPGTWLISARADGAPAYAEKTIVVTAGDESRVELELTDLRAVSGTVRDAFGQPVAGAGVDCVVSLAAGVAPLLSAITRDDGTFQIEVGSSTRPPILCSVQSFAGVQGYRLTPGQRADLVLPAALGHLRITALPPVNRLNSLWLVSADGRLVLVSEFIRGVDRLAVLEIGALAPDDWTLVQVRSTADWIALTSGGAASLPRLGRASVKGGETTILDLAKAIRP